VRRALPERVHLPGGQIARLSERAARDAYAARPKPPALPACLEHLEILKAPGVLLDDRGQPIDPLGMPVSHAHVLRAILLHAGVLPEEEAPFTCENCGAAFSVAPTSLLEIGPFVDGELDDPELDAPFPFEKAHPIPAVRVGGAVARSARLAERTVEEALPLWRASGAAELNITPAVVTAMGVVALGRERRASVIADALSAAPPRAWGAVVDLVLDAHYPRRLVAVFRCAKCGARMDLDVPLERELAREPLDEGASDAAEDEDESEEPLAAEGERRDEANITRSGKGTRAPFPSRDQFEKLVRAAADEIYRARGVRNIDLFIDTGVPACDDGGEPLLGCYTPGGVDALLDIYKSPEVRIFYRTFRAEHRADPAFDVEREIYETIDHEVVHHLHHLAGDDPVDDAERAEIDIERARIIGRRESARRAARGFAGDIAGFIRVTWPIWVILAAGTALAFCRG
jgi:hypothetical protein